MSPEEQYLQNLDMIKRLAALEARRRRLNADETDEFIQEVCVHLLDNDYAIIRKFKGESKFATYLHTVIQRQYQQWRVAEWGKWRPSAEAKRLGDIAIALERFMTRDGYTFYEAAQLLTVRADAPCTIATLEAIYIRLPLRGPRPMLVSEDVSPDAASVEPDADERLEARERVAEARRCADVLNATIPTLPPEDQAILRLRYDRALTAPEIAGTLRIEAKKVYKRLEKLHVILRRALVAAGVSEAMVARLLIHGDQEIRLNLLSEEENESAGPSDDTGEDGVKGGGGRL